MLPAETRKEVAEVMAEAAVEVLIGVDAEELPDRFNGPDLALSEGWRRATLSQLVAQVKETIATKH